MRSQHQFGQGLAYLVATVVALGLVTAPPALAATKPVTVTVTAVGRTEAAPPPIKKEDVELFQGKERMQVADWKRGETLFLTILIGDSLDPEVASQWDDLKAFINAQPVHTYIAVAYSRNGEALVAQDFTDDHALAAKALRLPLGTEGAFTSPYLSLQDWLKRWPTPGGDRRSIIMISSGIDYFRGGFDPINPDLDSTIELAQKENINVWTIYYPDDGHVGRGFYRVFNAQSNLSRLSEETGAESYYLGFRRPVSFKPYLDEIQHHLKNQYLLTFKGSADGKNGKFERVQVATEIPRVEFLAPSEVFLPASQ